MKSLNCCGVIAMSLVLPAAAVAGTIVSGRASVATRVVPRAGTTAVGDSKLQDYTQISGGSQIDSAAEGSGTNRYVSVQDDPAAPPTAAGAQSPTVPYAQISAVQYAMAQWSTNAGHSWGALAGDTLMHASAAGLQGGIGAVSAFAEGTSQAFVSNYLNFEGVSSVRVLFAQAPGDLGSSRVNGHLMEGTGELLLTSAYLSFELHVLAGIASRQGHFLPEEGPPYAYLLPATGPQSLFTGIAVLWGTETLPGETPENPLLPGRILGIPVGGGDEPADMPQEASGSFLTMPVVGDFGTTNFIFVDPEVATGYRYEAEGANFASFIVPDPLSGGDATFELRFGAFSHTLLAGQEFKFTDFVAGGVSSFQLLGIDPGENIDPTVNAPFVSGYKFTNEGLVSVTQWALTNEINAVPEPSGCVLFIVGTVGLAGAGWWNRRRTENPEAQPSVARH